ncbi:hypothetical protein [uncultured Methylophaga sp.]|uniref:hypothetical protein n=1 Tax=uncultured Methylophaga sp. TaxID=285271 RepID=UPI00262573F4|nr:hypothetical protein [uncultured Methylophaga sp.]
MITKSVLIAKAEYYVAGNGSLLSALIFGAVAAFTYVLASALPISMSNQEKIDTAALDAVMIGFREDQDVPEHSLKTRLSPAATALINEGIDEVKEQRKSRVESDPNYKLKLKEPEALTSTEQAPSVLAPQTIRSSDTINSNALN